MNKIFNVSKIKDIKKQYATELKRLYKTQADYTKICGKSNCINCPIAIDDMELPLAERYRRCNGCQDAPAIISALQIYLDSVTAIDAIKAEYAKRVFEVLSKIEPQLFFRAKKEVLTWKQAFPGEFSEIPASLYSSLVALVEEDGGRYRLL